MMAGLNLAGSDLGSWCCAYMYMCGGSRLSGVNIIGLVSTGCWLQLDNEPEHTLKPHENQLKTKEDQGAWAMSFPERRSDSSLVKQLLNQQSWWPVSDHLAGEETEHGGPGLLWSSRGERPLWTYSRILGNYFRDGLRWHKSSALADVPAGSVPFGHSQCDKTAPFRAAFYCGESKAHLRVFEVNGSS